MRAGLSVAFGPDRFLPVCWILVCVRVVSRVVFHSWVAPHFRSWAGPPSGASQIDAGDRYPRSPELEEQISRPVAVVVAAGRSRVAMCSDFPGPAEYISQPAVAVAPVVRGFELFAAVLGRRRVVGRSEFPGSAD